jgi:PAS domain S-box-containing protein
MTTASTPPVRDGALLAERLSLAVTAAGIGTWDFDPQTGELDWDDRCRELFGLPAGAAVTYEGAFLAGLHPDDRARSDEAVQAALDPSGPGSYSIEYRTVGPQDGVERWLSATGQAYFQDGRAIRFVGTVRDISARKEAERRFDIVNRAGAAVAAELDLQKVVQIVTDASVELAGAEYGAFFYNIINPEGDVYMLYALSGAPEEAFAKFPMPRITEVFEPTFAGTGVVRSDDIRNDPRHGRNPPHNGMPKGHLPVRSYLAVPVMSRSGEVLGGLLFGHSETGVFREEHEEQLLGMAGHAAAAIENARLYQAIQRHNETLEQKVAEEVQRRSSAEDALRQSQKMEAIGQLTGGIAHDFNNLLGAVGGSLSLIERKLFAGRTDIQRYIDAGQDAVRRAAMLTQRLLAFSRRQTLDARPVDPNQLVAGMAELVRRSVGPSITLDLQLADGVWPVKADVSQLENALLNLCINSRDAMGAEGGSLTISSGNVTVPVAEAVARDMQPGAYASLTVTDTGAGMPPEVIARVFEPFFTTKPIGQGTGLGLSMVYGFVRQSGGQVRIASEPGRGTTVELLLPRHAGEAAASEAPKSAAGMEAGSGETVLVVDDEPILLMLMSDVLDEAGYRVLRAADGPSALATLRREREVDLLVTDVGLPGGMNGRQLADAARELRPAQKCLFVTGYAAQGVLSDIRLDAGMALMPKPFEMPDFAARVREMLA